MRAAGDGWWPVLGAALSLSVIFVAVLSIPLTVASDIGLSSEVLIGWIVAVYGVAGGLTLALVLRYRQPLLLTGNVFILIFIASLGARLSWAELVGASMVAGALVLVVGLLGLTGRLAEWLPAPIVYGLLAGAVLPFLVDLFSALGEARLVVGGTLIAYLAGRRVLGPRGAAILPALVAGLILAGVTGGLGSDPIPMTWPVPALLRPELSVEALLTATPVMVVLITLQANVPSLVFLRGEGYRPPQGTIGMVSGLGTLVGSVLGPTGISLSLPATALVAGGDAGARRLRHRAAALAAGASVAIALLAGVAGALRAVIPRSLLVALVGLAVVGILATALEEVVRGPLSLGPLFAFTVALSDLSLFGLGPFFWALVLGLGTSWFLEREGWRRLRDGTGRTPQRGIEAA